MKKILLTGGLGFIGSHCLVELLNLKKDIICIDNFLNSSPKVLSQIKKISSTPFLFKSIGIQSAELNQIFLENDIDTIIHFAGLKSVGESDAYPGKYFYNNVIGSKYLFDVAKKFKVKNFIFSSSATVYGDPLFLPLNENHPVRAISPYGQNKIDIERMLIEDDFFKNKCSVKILRYFNPAGAHPTGLLGENPKGIPNNLMPYILKVAKKELPKVSVFGNDYPTSDGTGVRDYIHIMDLIDGHISALNYQKKGISIFNLGTGHGYSVLDLIYSFQEVNKIEIPHRFVARRAGDVAEIFANSSKATSILNFKPKRSINDMCADAWNFAKKNKRCF